MDVALGDLTFLTDGADYICIWSPPGEKYTSENARPLAIISVSLISDEADFQKWQKEVSNRWKVACAEIVNDCADSIHVEPVLGVRNTN
jgi:hypothetical protein